MYGKGRHFSKGGKEGVLSFLFSPYEKIRKGKLHGFIQIRGEMLDLGFPALSLFFRGKASSLFLFIIGSIDFGRWQGVPGFTRYGESFFIGSQGSTRPFSGKNKGRPAFRLRKEPPQGQCHWFNFYQAAGKHVCKTFKKLQFHKRRRGDEGGKRRSFFPHDFKNWSEGSFFIRDILESLP